MLDQYFEQYGWDYEQFDNETFVSGFQGEASTFQIFIKSDDDWVYFMLLPFINKPKPEYQEKVYSHLLHLNYEMNLVKAGIDDDGDVFLAVEIPTDNLDYQRFCDALDALSYYADTHYLQTLNLAA